MIEMSDVPQDKPAGEPPLAPPAATSPTPAIPPRRPVPPPPPGSRDTFAVILPAICLVAVGVLWLRMDGQIAELRDMQRRLAQAVAE